jgi:polysaccharide export outer membrane protein
MAMPLYKQAALAALASLWLGPPALAAAPPAAAPPLITPVYSNDYKIGAYDMLDIEVFEVEDLHRKVQVDGAGTIVLPLIGAVQAQGMTPGQLSDELRQRLEARFIKNPKVSVQVKQSQSERVTVDGAVGSPGVYPLSGPTTLLQAVAMAKGPDSVEANVHKVTLFRNEGARWTHTQYDLAKIRHGQEEDPVVRGQDVIVVAGSKKPAVLRAASAILPWVLLIPVL